MKTASEYLKTTRDPRSVVDAYYSGIEEGIAEGRRLERATAIEFTAWFLSVGCSMLHPISNEPMSIDQAYDVWEKTK